MEKNNLNLYVIEPDSEKSELLRLLLETLLHASIYIDDLMDELEEYEREPMESVLMICLDPTKAPWLEFSDRAGFPELMETVEISQEVSTGLLMAYLKEEMITDEQGHHLVGPAILFNCDGNGKVVPVTSEDYDAAEELYCNCVEDLKVFNVRFPSIKVHLAGDPIT